MLIHAPCSLPRDGRNPAAACPHSRFRSGILLLICGLLAATGCGEPTTSNPPPAATGPGSESTTPATPADTHAEKPATPVADPAAGPTTPGPAKPPVAPPPVDQTVDADQVKTVRKLVDDTLSSDSKVVQPALDRLKEMGSLAALALAEIVEKDTDAPARRVAALDQLESLKFLTNPRAAKVVVAALEADDIALKQHAIGASGRHKLKDAIPALKKILNDPAQQVLHTYATQALIQLGDTDALAVAKAQLASPDPVARGKAVYMIRKQGDHTNLTLLKPLATDKDDEVRAEVVEACGDLGDVEAVEVLAVLLEDKKHEIVRDTCKHLKRITGVNLGREPEKWKEWYLKEFVPKGRAAFAKAAPARPAPDQPGKPKVRMQPQPAPGGPNGPGMPPPPPDDGQQNGEGDNEY